MELTEQQLQQIIPKNKYVSYWYQALQQLLPQYEINTTDRIAAFLAQCAHESGGFVFIKENLNYRWQSLRKTFPKYFPTDALAQQYEKQPERIANRVYANRMGNGPEESGDGWRFCGRGLIQLTGRENYTRFGNSLNMTAEEALEYMETFEGAAQSACWFWESNNLNKWADSNDLVTLTKRINGGTNGLEDRCNYYNNIINILKGY